MYKQVIILRKDLGMRKGKMIAQGAHASMAAILKVDPLTGYSMLNNTEEVSLWLKHIFTKICVYVNSEKDLLEIYEQGKAKKLHCSLIQDSGLTEFKGIPTYTAVALGPALVEELDSITGELPLL